MLLRQTLTKISEVRAAMTPHLNSESPSNVQRYSAQHINAQSPEEPPSSRIQQIWSFSDSLGYLKPFGNIGYLKTPVGNSTCENDLENSTENDTMNCFLLMLKANSCHQKSTDSHDPRFLFYRRFSRKEYKSRCPPFKYYPPNPCPEKPCPPKKEKPKKPECVPICATQKKRRSRMQKIKKSYRLCKKTPPTPQVTSCQVPERVCGLPKKMPPCISFHGPNCPARKRPCPSVIPPTPRKEFPSNACKKNIESRVPCSCNERVHGVAVNLTPRRVPSKCLSRQALPSRVIGADTACPPMKVLAGVISDKPIYPKN